MGMAPVLLHGARLLAGGGIGQRGQRDEAGPLLGVGLVDAAPRGAVHADIGHGVQPLAALRVQVVPGGEGAAAQEVLLEVEEGALDLAAPLFVPRPPHRWLEAIVTGELQEGRMPARAAADAAQGDGGLIVIGDPAAQAPVVRERRLVGPQQGRQAFVPEEPHEQAPGARQDQGKGVHHRQPVGDQHAIGTPVRLRLLARRRLEAAEAAGCTGPHWAR